ncbi:MAG: hypothetical protein ABI839_04075 [Verrucomicrobiota bacterium]
MLYRFQKIVHRGQIVWLVALTAIHSVILQEISAQDAVTPPVTLAPATPQKPTDTSAPSAFESSATLSAYFFGKNNIWDKTYDEIEALKAKSPLVLSVGANHWFHIDRNERIYGNGYGVPTESGTYYYYLGADYAHKLVGDGFFQEIGAHVQFKFRDDQNDKLRAFYSDTYWFYENYAYAKTSVGTFKAGQFVTEFGIPWDGTWWESVPYFDGYKFDPDYGISWDNTWKVSDKLSIESAAQFFFVSDGVNGSIQGADAESGRFLSERNTGVVRLVPTWKFNKDLKLAVGVSGLYGGIKGAQHYTNIDDTRGVVGSDATLTYKNFSVFAEYIDAFGATNPLRYVSGGASERVNSIRGGVSYKYGPATFHVNYSYGWDHHPKGHQSIFAPGLNFQVTKNVVLYAEYVKWDVTDRRGVTAKFDDGFELIAVWNL